MRNQRPAAGGHGGFTLVEILLVVVLIGIASAVALPTFAKSFRGAKLRTSMRMVLAMHRNAQSKAVLGQAYTALLFDVKKGTVELVEQGGGVNKTDAFFGNLETGAASDGGMGSVTTGAEAASAGNGGGDGEEGVAPVSFALRRLEDTVRFESFKGGKEIDDLFYVNYYPNGMCEGYRVTLGDEEGRRRTMTVNAITGKAKVSDE